MNEFKRVALFFAPESQSPLATFGAQWLGWDVETAKPADHPSFEGLPAPISEITQTPRKYGFHGTLKAPFRLAEGYSIADLQDAVRDFCQQRKIFSIGMMQVSQLGSFVAIVPSGDAVELGQFASDVVRKFDMFRAPLSDDEIAKRRASQLTDYQDQLMLEWGYPYIFDQFRFHLTLSGKLSEQDAATVQRVVNAHISDILSKPVPVVDLCLYGEREDGLFEIIERFPLGGSTEP